MASLLQKATIKVRRDTAGNFTSNNPTLNQGEWGFETDAGKVKIGDGSTAWTSLGYAGETGIVAAVATNTSDIATKITGSTDQIAKAWINFNGTGTVVIRDSFNVSSLDDNGTGIYRINYTNALDSVDYVVAGMGNHQITNRFVRTVCKDSNGSILTTAVDIVTAEGATAANDGRLVDISDVYVMMIGG